MLENILQDFCRGALSTVLGTFSHRGNIEGMKNINTYTAIGILLALISLVANILGYGWAVSSLSIGVIFLVIGLFASK